MSKVTYLDHSGFAVTTADAILVFDFSADPGRHLKHLLEEHPDHEVVFFVSHHHPDHFNESIFEMAQNRSHAYVLSNDIDSRLVPDKGLQVAWMSKGDAVEQIKGIKRVEAFGSTDKGVSFAVTTNSGEVIFHGGDLNDWSAFDDTRNDRDRSVAEYKAIVDRIADTYPAVKAAILAVDARLGENATDGANYFTRRINVDNFFPMHLNGSPEQACDFSAYLPAATKGHCLTSPGRSVEI